MQRSLDLRRVLQRVRREKKERWGREREKKTHFFSFFQTTSKKLKELKLTKTKTVPKLETRNSSWVAPDVCARFGIEPTAEAAWERRAREAGASSSSAAASASREKLKSQRGWSEARALAATKLRANPNSYFYRHVEPGQQQANGEWTREELELFLRTARAHGVGDR